MARAQVNLGQVTEQLRPVASPIDTYVRPADPPKSGLWELASALGGFERELDSYVSSRKAEADKLDAARAEADFMRNNREGFAEGVASGNIPAWSSPTYVESYKAAEGAALGNRLMLKAQADYMVWDGKGGTDPAAFDRFSTDFLAKNITTQDPRVLRGLLPVVKSGMASLQAQFHQDLSQSVYKGNIEQHGIVSSQTIDKYDLEGLRQPTGTDYEGLWDTLMTIRGSALKVGAKGDDYDKTLVKTLAEKAIERRDPGLLKLLDRKLPGATYALSDTANGASTRLETANRLEVLGRQAQMDAERRHEKEEKRLKAGVTSSAIDLLATDPTKPLPQDLLDAGQRVDPEFKIKALDWQRRLAEGGVQEDPKALAGLYSEIFGGGGMDAVSKALSNGTIKTAGGLKEATSYVKAIADGGVGQRILQGTTVETTLKTIESRAPNKTPLSAFDLPGISDAGLRAQTEYKRTLIDWALRNPNAGPMEQEKARAEIGGAILSGLSGGVGDKASYSRPPDDALKAVGAEPGALPPRPTPPPAPQPSPVEVFKQSFTPEDRQRLEQRATERGLDPNAVWVEMQKARERATSQPGASDTQQRLDELQRMYTPRPQSANQPPAPASPLRPIAFSTASVNSAITEAATTHGMDLGTLSRYAQIESGGDPTNQTGSYKGLFQLSDREFAKYGPPGGNIWDPKDNALAAAAKLKAESERFKATTGREATPTDLYMIHQQGEAGYAAHLKNPTAPAWENMWSTGEGQAKGAGWARSAIWGNVPTNLRAMFPGGVDTVTSADFVSLWRHKVEGTPLQGTSATTPRSQPGTPDATASWLKRFAANFGLRL